MYKVLIADDEKLIRITLKKLIDWASFDCEVVATARDGLEAFELFLKFQPQIVISDLKMPGMDGIELIKKIKGHSPYTQVIALSNYSDYAYVRDAMKAGAFDYLLKLTLEKRDLESIIVSVRQLCVVSDQKNDAYKEGVIKAFQQFLMLCKNKHLVDQEEQDELFHKNCFLPFQNAFQMAYFRIDSIDEVYAKIKDREALRLNIQNLIGECMPKSNEYMVVFISHHSGIVLFNSDQKLRVINCCASIIRSIALYLNMHISISVSDVHSSFENFNQLFLNLLASHETRFYMEEGALIQSENQKSFQSLDLNEEQFGIDILAALKVRDFDKVSQINEELCKFILDRCVEPKIVKEYIIFILNNIEGNEIAKGRKKVISFLNFRQRVKACENIQRFKSELFRIFEEIEQYMQDVRQNKYRKEVMDIMEYIEKHYYMKLPLRSIADYFDMNESSMSRLFKNETGKNLNFYINELKMQKAMDILSNDAKRIKDVALAVGMDDQLYFNKVFKKFYHVSPSAILKRDKKVE